MLEEAVKKLIAYTKRNRLYYRRLTRLYRRGLIDKDTFLYLAGLIRDGLPPIRKDTLFVICFMKDIWDRTVRLTLRSLAERISSKPERILALTRIPFRATPLELDVLFRLSSHLDVPIEAFRGEPLLMVLGQRHTLLWSGGRVEPKTRAELPEYLAFRDVPLRIIEEIEAIGQ